MSIKKHLPKNDLPNSKRTHRQHVSTAPPPSTLRRSIRTGSEGTDVASPEGRWACPNHSQSVRNTVPVVVKPRIFLMDFSYL